MPNRSTRARVVRGLLGFFGGILAFLFIPKALGFMVRRFLFGFIGRMVAMATLGFVLDWVAGRLNR